MPEPAESVGESGALGLGGGCSTSIGASSSGLFCFESLDSFAADGFGSVRCEQERVARHTATTKQAFASLTGENIVL